MIEKKISAHFFVFSVLSFKHFVDTNSLNIYVK